MKRNRLHVLFYLQNKIIKKLFQNLTGTCVTMINLIVRKNRPQQQKQNPPKIPTPLKPPKSKQKPQTNKPTNPCCLNLAAIDILILFFKQHLELKSCKDSFSNHLISISPKRARLLCSINKFMSLMS